MTHELTKTSDAGNNGAQGRGRPSKLTPETEMRILSAVRCGASNVVACEAAGIAKSTLSSWLSQAKKEDAPEALTSFAEKLERARAEGVVARLAMIQKSAGVDWRAAAWMLERDDPNAYSMRWRAEHPETNVTWADLFEGIDEEIEKKIDSGMLLEGKFRDIDDESGDRDEPPKRPTPPDESPSEK